MTSTEVRRTRYGAGAVAIAPVVVLVAFAAHPFIARLPDAAAIADAVMGGTTLWAVVHLLTALGSVLIALAFLAVRAHLREAGEDRFSAWALPWVVVGSALYALLPALEFAPLAAAQSGGDVVAVQAALQPWFVLVLAMSAFTFAVGVVGFARGIAASRVLTSPVTAVVVAGLLVLAVSRFVPLGVVQFYVQGAAGLVALWPLAHRMWTSTQRDQAVHPQAAPAG